MIKSTSISLRNFFFKKKPIWSLFPALIPYRLFAVEREQTTSKN